MSSIQPTRLPDVALLRKYDSGGAYADCYMTDVAGAVSHATFVEAFYTTSLFKVERTLLNWFAARPSTDFDAKQLAEANSDLFAAWRVEGRSTDQLLLADFTGRTRSWLMVAPVEGKTNGPRTRLYFGSAVVPRTSTRRRRPDLGFTFHALLGFHRLYSRALLYSARARLLATQRAAT